MEWIVSSSAVFLHYVPDSTRILCDINRCPQEKDALIKKSLGKNRVKEQ